MNNFSKDDEDNIKTYENLLQKHGDSHESLNWGSLESQQLRFKILYEIGLKNGDSVLDLGCGLGDFYGWFLTHKIDIDYTGVDITSAAISLAKDKYPQTKFPQTKFLCENYLKDKNIPTRYDYICASGLFAKRYHDPEKFLYQSIETMFAGCSKGCAFNLLNKQADLDENDIGFSPDDVFAFCRTITPWTVLRMDYHIRDFTLYMFKERNI